MIKIWNGVHGTSSYGISQCTCSYGSFMSDGKCELCSPGSGSDGNGSCRQCYFGQYQDEYGGLNCKYCPPGTYNDIWGAVECKPCPDLSQFTSYGMSRSLSDCSVPPQTNCPEGAELVAGFCVPMTNE